MVTPKIQSCGRGIVTDRDPTDMTELSNPSLFWQHLGGEHRTEAEAHGFDDVKRRQALRYFTWQWHVRSIRRSEQMRSLLRDSPITDWIRFAVAPFSARAQTWSPLAWRFLDRWLYTFAIRLLWEYARRHGDPTVLRLDEPLLGNPPPVQLRGRLISQDLANSALEMEAIRRVTAERPPRSILEIGGGYGRTAYVLLSIFPEITYTIVDIEPAIGIFPVVPHEAVSRRAPRIPRPE